MSSFEPLLDMLLIWHQHLAIRVRHAERRIERRVARNPLQHGPNSASLHAPRLELLAKTVASPIWASYPTAAAKSAMDTAVDWRTAHG